MSPTTAPAMTVERAVDSEQKIQQASEPFIRETDDDCFHHMDCLTGVANGTFDDTRSRSGSQRYEMRFA